MKIKVVIVGGGIGGLTTAIALRRIGIDVEIYERASRLREIGAVILLWPNATRILRDLDVLDALLEKGHVVTHCEIRSWKGQWIKRWQIPRLTTPAIFIHRADLQSTLLEAIPPGQIHLGEALEGFDQNETGVRVRFGSGKTAEANILIGADGLHSTARQQLFGSQPPIYRGYTQWLGLLDGSAEVLEAGLKMEWWGHGIRFGMGVNGKGRMNWYLSVNRPGPETAGKSKANLLQWVHGWQKPVEEMIQSTPAEQIIQINIWSRPPEKTWGRGRVTLLGDAAHPTSPDMGQGAGMAIEDAVCIAKCLTENRDVPYALRRYESLRQRRTALITNRSRLVGSMAQWAHPAAVALRTFFLKGFPGFIWERQLKSIYSYQIDPAIK